MNKQKENSNTDQTKTSKRYAFAQRKGDDFSCLKILDGQYEGIIYKYNEVKFSQTENANGEIPLKFTYDIMANPNEEDVNSEDFRNYIGDILVECVDEQLKNGNIQIDE
jgi:hypothetical protein|tara:strand:- start:6084 stop:6410 length:327 start_codon:yes stop_codon:yes gene_type:complete